MTVLYFIEAQGAIKIGITNDIKRRMYMLQNGSPVRLKLLGTVEGTVADERRIHFTLKDHRLTGEWFLDCPEVRSEIAGHIGSSRADAEVTEFITANYHWCCEVAARVKATKPANRHEECIRGEITGALLAAMLAGTFPLRQDLTQVAA